MNATRGIGETLEHYFWRTVDEVGYLTLSPLEQLAVDLLEGYRLEAEQHAALVAELEFDRDEYENRAYYLEERVAELESENEQLMEISADADETTQDDEVEFLKGLVRDLEDELAAIDAGQVAVA
jgi:hypothetical protein